MSLVPIATVVHLVDKSKNITSTSTVTNTTTFVLPKQTPKLFYLTTEYEIAPYTKNAAGTNVAIVTSLDATALTNTISSLTFPSIYHDYDASYVVEHGVSGPSETVLPEKCSVLRCNMD